MNGPQRSNENQPQSQARPQIPRNFWSLLDTNLPQRASALVSLVVQPFDADACGDRASTRTCKADGGNCISCPSCGYDMTNFLANRREIPPPTPIGMSNISSQGNRNSIGSGSQSRKEQQGNTYPVRNNAIQSNNPSQQSQRRNSLTSSNGVKANQVFSQSAHSAHSAEITTKRQSIDEPPCQDTNATYEPLNQDTNAVFNSSDYPVCIETIRNTPSVLSSSRLYMQDIKVVQNMKECWERFLELKVQATDTTIQLDMGTERKINPEASTSSTQRHNKCIQTSNTSAGRCNLSATINNSAQSGRKVGYSATSVKSAKQANQQGSNNNSQKRSFHEVQAGFEQSYNTQTSNHEETSMEQQSNRRTSTQPTHISSEEKVKQWMNNNSENSNQNAQRTSQTVSPSQNSNNKKADCGGTIIEMATDFDLVSCGGGVAVEMDQNRRNSAGRESARNSKGTMSAERRNSNQDKQRVSDSQTANNDKNINTENSGLPQDSSSFEVYEC